MIMNKETKKEEAINRMYAYGKELIEDGDGTMVIGWYDDDEGNCIKDRD